MDSEYDAIVLGTGLKESILSGMLSTSGKRVLHIARNDYYDSESALITPLGALLSRFSIASDLARLFQKRRFHKFLSYVQAFQEGDIKTWKDLDPTRTCMHDLYDKFGLDKKARNFTGHVLALFRDDDYLNEPAVNTIRRIKSYAGPLARCGKSSFLYPIYGTGGIPQDFARSSVRYGGTYIADKAIDEIVIGIDGRVIGVRSGDEIAKGKQVYCDPGYVPDKVRKRGQVIRCICLLDHPISNTKGAFATHMVVSPRQVGLTSDIYVSVLDCSHPVTTTESFAVMVSATADSGNPESGIKPGLDLLQPIAQKFMYVSDYYEPTDNGLESQIFISESYDAKTYFETTCLDVLDIIKRGSVEIRSAEN